jgi:hypothetical protein
MPVNYQQLTGDPPDIVGQTETVNAADYDNLIAKGAIAILPNIIELVKDPNVNLNPVMRGPSANVWNSVTNDLLTAIQALWAKLHPGDNILMRVRRS